MLFRDTRCPARLALLWQFPFAASSGVLSGLQEACILNFFSVHVGSMQSTGRDTNGIASVLGWCGQWWLPFFALCHVVARCHPGRLNNVETIASSLWFVFARLFFPDPQKAKPGKENTARTGRSQTGEVFLRPSAPQTQTGESPRSFEDVRRCNVPIGASGRVYTATTRTQYAANFSRSSIQSSRHSSPKRWLINIAECCVAIWVFLRTWPISSLRKNTSQLIGSR